VLLAAAVVCRAATAAEPAAACDHLDALLLAIASGGVSGVTPL
jgi:hypothetical protein